MQNLFTHADENKNESPFRLNNVKPVLYRVASFTSFYTFIHIIMQRYMRVHMKYLF